jgi:hypothetical protein
MTAANPGNKWIHLRRANQARHTWATESTAGARVVVWQQQQQHRCCDVPADATLCVVIGRSGSWLSGRDSGMLLLLSVLSSTRSRISRRCRRCRHQTEHVVKESRRQPAKADFNAVGVIEHWQKVECPVSS